MHTMKNVVKAKVLLQVTSELPSANSARSCKDVLSLSAASLRSISVASNRCGVLHPGLTKPSSLAIAADASLCSLCRPSKAESSSRGSSLLTGTSYICCVCDGGGGVGVLGTGVLCRDGNEDAGRRGRGTS